LLDCAIEHRREIEVRLRQIPEQILALQTQLESLLDEKTRLQQQRRRAESLIAFGVSPRLPREHAFCPNCYINHGTRTRLAAATGSSANDALQCEICAARFVQALPGAG